MAANSPPEAAPTGPKRRGRPQQTNPKNLLDRLERYQAETLCFMTDFTVPFDNNLTERDLRMMQVQQKVSGGFRTPTGAQVFGRICSYLSTARTQARSMLSVLEHLFLGHPCVPSPLLE
ncbi:MAG: transposase [Armatimonadetes bacterium]|nr:transposase [Armatimonadota bacterium]